MTRGNSSNDGKRDNGGNDDEGWGSTFFKLATATAAVAAAAAAAGGNDDEGWGSKFFILATAAAAVAAVAATAAVAGGLYSLMSSSSTPQNRWTKPEQGWVKLNVDGSRDHIGYPNSSGCGGVLRDSSGTWLLGFSQKLDPRYEVDMTEIVAILKGVELAKEMNVKKLVVESDHKSAVSMVKNGVRKKHPQYISDIQQLLSDPKWEVKVVHIPRKANGVANKLANDARDLSSMEISKYRYPPNGCSTLVKEDSLGGGDVVFV